MSPPLRLWSTIRQSPFVADNGHARLTRGPALSAFTKWRNRHVVIASSYTHPAAGIPMRSAVTTFEPPAFPRRWTPTGANTFAGRRDRENHRLVDKAVLPGINQYGLRVERHDLAFKASAIREKDRENGPFVTPFGKTWILGRLGFTFVQSRSPPACFRIRLYSGSLGPLASVSIHIVGQHPPDHLQVASTKPSPRRTLPQNPS